MTLRGTIKNGHVQLESASDLPDGTPVDVRPAQPRTLAERLLEHAIDDPTLPKDFASEIDHYLYGTPKRNGKRTTKGRRATGARARIASRKPKPRKRGR